jgi:Bacteriophage Lambda NinG protein
MRRKSKTDRAKAKELAWVQFSRFIRTRDCIRFTGDPTQGKCVTCNRPYAFKDLRAGHFIQGRGNSVLFDPRLVYSQCDSCNTNPPYGKGGNYVEYFRFMLDEVGLAKIDEFRALKHETTPYKTYQLLDIAETYRQKTEGLLKSVG